MRIVKSDENFGTPTQNEEVETPYAFRRAGDKISDYLVLFDADLSVHRSLESPKKNCREA